MTDLVRLQVGAPKIKNLSLYFNKFRFFIELNLIKKIKKKV